MGLFRVRLPQVLLAIALLGLLCVAAPAAVSQADNQAQAGQCSGYYYTVKLGETWLSIARRVGQPVAALKAANPQAVRARDLIYAGEKLCVPSQGGGVAQGGYWYQVKPGDTWNKVSRATGVPLQQLLEANRSLVNRRQWLYIGQRVWIPTSPASATPTGGTPTSLSTATATPTAVAPVATEPVATSTATPTVVPTATPTLVLPEPTAGVPTSSPTAVPSAAPVLPAATATSPAPAGPTPTLLPVPADCPQNLAGYADAVAAYLNQSGGAPSALQPWLVACRVVGGAGEGVAVAPITGPNATDVIVVLHDPAPNSAATKGELLIYHKGSKGYVLARKVAGQGRVELVQAADINTDGKFDVVYSDTSCGAHTCFGTLFVDSWNGKTYEDWITDTPTIADPEYRIKDVAPEGQGSEVQVHGGVIGSVGAGPQRAWTETYISPKGAPYVLFSQVYDPSTCLYHKILDANQAFDKWALDGFDPAIEAYKAAIADQAATACGAIKDEVATLRDFARFRLIVAYIAAGRATEGVALPGQITNAALKGAATAFLKSYEDNGSVIQACRDTTKYAEANKASWQFLADWGYANPSFTPGDLCPLN